MLNDELPRLQVSQVINASKRRSYRTGSGSDRIQASTLEYRFHIFKVEVSHPLATARGSVSIAISVQTFA
jgi:hypothetical protein